MLFATKIARKSTGTAIYYLTTRVKDTYQIYWLKIIHILNYFRGTKYLPLILSEDKSVMLKWFIDGSYAVHPNMRGHTGGGLTMARGFPISLSRNHKLNTRIYTKSEIVGVDQLMPLVLWTRIFL